MPSPDNPEPESAVSAELEAKRAEVQDLEDRAVEQRLAMVEIRNRITGPLGANEERNQARAALAEAAARLDQIESTLERMRAELATLEARATPSGADTLEANR